MAKPYSKSKIAYKYFKYFLSAKSKHAVHSPFTYNFVDNVVTSAFGFQSRKIERERKRLLKSSEVIDFKDFGKQGNVFRREISSIAKNALKSKKYAQLLGQTVKFYKPKKVLELGTSLGLTTACLAQKNTEVITIEGDPTVAKKAKEVWEKLKLNNITSIVGDFDSALDSVKEQVFDIIYIDGNHHYTPTMRYFKILQKNAHPSTLFIFDDIHYSKEMERVWTELKNMHKVRVSIDLFFLGFISLDESLSKQDYVIRY